MGWLAYSFIKKVHRLNTEEHCRADLLKHTQKLTRMFLFDSFRPQDPFVAVANIPGLMLGVWYTLTTYRLAAPDVARSIEKVGCAQFRKFFLF